MKVRTPIVVLFGVFGMVFSFAQSPANEEISLLQDAIERFTLKSGSARILGGQEAKWSDNPWQVALVYANDPNNARAQFCGGSYVAPGWVVTAAHCIDRRYGPEHYQIFSGGDNLLQSGVRSKVTKYIVHEQWRLTSNKSRYDHDIALLQIATDSPQISGSPIPVTSPSIDLDSLRQEILVTGWGVTERRPTGTEKLMQVSVPLVPTSPTCNATKAYNGRVTEYMFCAGLAQGGKDSCQGDSGGPATAVVSGRRVLIGVVSWGDGCGVEDKYGVYTRLARYADWMKNASGGQVSY